MEPNTEARLAAIEARVEAIYVSVEKTRKYFLWSMITTIIFFVLPLLALGFVIPFFLSSYVGNITSLSGL